MIDNYEDYKIVSEQLKQSPFLYMSLGAMELFHSNFFYWLMRFDKRYASAFFQELENIKEDFKFNREYKHTDISIKVDNNYYLIENKIKSLVDKKQLTEYETKFRNGKTRFAKGIYLFPIKLEELNKLFADDIKSSHKWEFVDYRTIMNKIKCVTNSIANDKIDEKDKEYLRIISDYLEMTDYLIDIIEYSVNYYKNNYIIQDKKDVLFNDLKELRIYDIIRKINCDLLKRELEKKLKEEFKESYNNISIESGFSNGQASLSARWKLNYDDNDENQGYFLIGPQLQDCQFRTMIHICTKYFNIENLKSKSKKEIRDTLDSIYSSIETAVFEKNGNYYKSKSTKEYKEFKGTHSNFEYVALYLYKRINQNIKNSLSFDNLCDMFIKTLKPLKDVNKDKLITSIKERLNNNSIKG